MDSESEILSEIQSLSQSEIESNDTHRNNRKRNNNNKTIDDALIFGFKRVLVRSEDEKKIISVYYISPDSKIISTLTDLALWLENHSNSVGLNNNCFSFVARKMSENENELFQSINSAPHEVKGAILKDVVEEVVPVSEASEGKEESSPKIRKLEVITSCEEIERNTVSISDSTESDSVGEDKMETGPGSKMITDRSNDNECVVISDDDDDVCVSVDNTNVPVKEVCADQEASEVKEAPPIEITELTTVESDKSKTNPIIGDSEIVEKPKEDISVKSTEAIHDITCNGITDAIHDAAAELVTNKADAVVSEAAPAKSALNSAKKSVGTQGEKTRPLYPSTYSYKTADLSQYRIKKLAAMSTLTLEPDVHHKINMSESRTSGHEQSLQRLTSSVIFYNVLMPNCTNACYPTKCERTRLMFECDFCLAMWHEQCSGHRWVTVRDLKMIVCDNCYATAKRLNLNYWEIFNNPQALFLSETKKGKTHPPMRMDHLVKLCQMAGDKTDEKNTIAKSVEQIAATGTNSALTIIEAINPDKTQVWRHIYKILLSEKNICHNHNEECVIIKYRPEDVEKLAELFADQECRLIVERKAITVLHSRITVASGPELRVPICARIIQPCQAVFYSTERGQASDPRYKQKVAELRRALSHGFKQLSSWKQVEKSVVGPRPISPALRNAVSRPSCRPPGRPVTMTAGVRLPVARMSFMPSHRLTAVPPIQRPPIYRSPMSGGLVPSVPPVPPVDDQIKRKRKQRLQTLEHEANVTDKEENVFSTNQTQKYLFLQSVHNNVLNLPYKVLEKILVSSPLTDNDRHNCRVANRIFKSIIDAAKMVTIQMQTKVTAE